MCLLRPKHKCSYLPSLKDCKLKIKGLHQLQASRHDSKIWRFHRATWGKERLQANKSYLGSLDPSRPQFVSWKLSNSRKIFSGILDSLTPTNLKSASTRFRQDTFGNINSLALNCSMWRQPASSIKERLRRNSRCHREVRRANPWSLTLTLDRIPFTPTLRNLGMRFWLQGEEL
jgi:hypothetical protein